jgi:hypothetical protein
LLGYKFFITEALATGIRGRVKDAKMGEIASG